MLEYPQMPDESNLLPPSRIVRWATVGVLIGLAVGFYFRNGTKLPPLSAPAPPAATGQPPN